MSESIFRSLPYMLSSTVASESLQLTGGERATGAIYTVLAATMLAYAMLTSGGERKALRRSAPLIVWLAVFVTFYISPYLR